MRSISSLCQPVPPSATRDDLLAKLRLIREAERDLRDARMRVSRDLIARRLANLEDYDVQPQHAP